MNLSLSTLMLAVLDTGLPGRHHRAASWKVVGVASALVFCLGPRPVSRTHPLPSPRGDSRSQSQSLAPHWSTSTCFSVPPCAFHSDVWWELPAPVAEGLRGGGVLCCLLSLVLLGGVTALEIRSHVSGMKCTVLSESGVGRKQQIALRFQIV